MRAETQPHVSDELAAWRALALRLMQALSDSHAGRAADAERHVVQQSRSASFERQLLQDREDFLGLVAHELKRRLPWSKPTPSCWKPRWLSRS
jgi:hypothetical protein